MRISWPWPSRRWPARSQYRNRSTASSKPDTAAEASPSEALEATWSSADLRLSCSLPIWARTLSAGEQRKVALGLLTHAGYRGWALDEPDAAKLVKLRFFAGLPVKEAAQLLGVSRATAFRYWAYAKAFLVCELEDKAG